MKPKAIAANMRAASLQPATNDQEEGRMKKSYTVYLFVLVTAMLLATLPLSAQTKPTPFEIANEVMMYQQSAVLSYIGSTLGPDPASPLTYSTYVDPAGQNFNFSLNAGSTYLGKPITLTTSGALNPFNVWIVSSTGTYNGLPWGLNSTYVPPTALGNGSLTPIGLYGYGAVIYTRTSTLNPGICPGCGTPTSNRTFTSIGGGEGPCITIDTSFDTDEVDCPQGDTKSIGLSFNDPNWWWDSTGPSGYWGSAYAIGTTPSNGSPGSSTSLTTPISVSTVSYFSDLGSGANTYQCCTGWPVSGSGAGTYTATANLFTALASGGVSKVDIGIGYVSGPDSFYASISTNSGGVPGVELARWDNLSSNLPLGQCCGVVSINGISGLSLTAGQSYFMVLGPEDSSSTTSLTWNLNSVVAKGQVDTNNGSGWNQLSGQTLGAFDILSQPQGTETNANEFQVTASGSVSQIDVAVGYVSGVNSFYVNIAADNNGQPGAVLASFTDLSSAQSFGDCCGLVSVTGISGLSLSSGTNYWIVVGPTALNSTTLEQWNLNTTIARGLDLFSLDGGTTWNSRGQQALGAFDVLGGVSGTPSATLYSNLGTGAYVYQCCSGWQLSGTASGSSRSLVKRMK